MKNELLELSDKIEFVANYYHMIENVDEKLFKYSNKLKQIAEDLDNE